jgi:Ribbon-helix-helix protein, copG family
LSGPLWRAEMVLMKRTTIYLTHGQAEALDHAAKAWGVSRSESIRRLVDRAIGGQHGTDLAADLAAIENSFGVLASEDS